jgi:hypothetical protein
VSGFGSDFRLSASVCVESSACCAALSSVAFVGTPPDFRSVPIAVRSSCQVTIELQNPSAHFSVAD